MYGMLKIGDRMPDFQVVDQDGNTVSSKDLFGKKTVIYMQTQRNKVKIKSVIILGPINDLEAKRSEKI